MCQYEHIFVKGSSVKNCVSGVTINMVHVLKSSQAFYDKDICKASPGFPLSSKFSPVNLQTSRIMH